jgi:hypothetical protein
VAAFVSPRSPFFQIASVLVRLDHVASFIVNANELAPAGKVMTVKRGGDGKISGAVVESVPDPS